MRVAGRMNLDLASSRLVSGGSPLSSALDGSNLSVGRAKRMKRLGWLHLLPILVVGALGPMLASHLEPLLRYRVQALVDRTHPILHLWYVLRTSAANRPLMGAGGQMVLARTGLLP